MTVHAKIEISETPLDETQVSPFPHLFGPDVRLSGKLSWNETDWRLMQKALLRQEGTLSATGALVVDTGVHSGRSPKDKFIVRDDELNDLIWWDQNQAMTRADFETLKEDMLAHACNCDLFVQDLIASPGGPEPMAVRVFTETAWASLFMRHLLRPLEVDAAFTPTLTILCLPQFKANPKIHGTRTETVIALDLAKGLVLIAGTSYAGEMKKAVFTALNFHLPQHNILPMHCSANFNAKGETALFFGLSGTGKTTLSADPSRMLIGDDEHGWSDKGVFNFENGCYAKAINLRADLEPDIHAASLAFGTVLENVILDPTTGEPDFSNGSKTENTRSAYALTKIGNAAPAVLAQQPKQVILLTADAFGVLPPVARLTLKQAIEWFLLGYTAKVAGTERGVLEPQATFSSCFGAPFLPLPPKVYANLLADKLEAQGTQCYLLNTGWTGGGYGSGTRIKLTDTRAMLRAILNGDVDRADMRLDDHFGLYVPRELGGVDADLLDPKMAWAEPSLYEDAAQRLSKLMQDQLLKMN